MAPPTVAIATQGASAAVGVERRSNDSASLPAGARPQAQSRSGRAAARSGRRPAGAPPMPHDGRGRARERAPAGGRISERGRAAALPLVAKARLPSMDSSAESGPSVSWKRWRTHRVSDADGQRRRCPAPSPESHPGRADGGSRWSTAGSSSPRSRSSIGSSAQVGRTHARCSRPGDPVRHEAPRRPPHDHTWMANRAINQPGQGGHGPRACSSCRPARLRL